MDGGSPPHPSSADESSPVVLVGESSRAPGSSAAASGKLLILKLPLWKLLPACGTSGSGRVTVVFVTRATSQEG